MLSLLILGVIASAGQDFPCTPTRVWDGDGPIWCAEGPRVRLQGIATRELSGRCRRGQPCPHASGIAARDVLVELFGGSRGVSRDAHVLVAGPRLTCRSAGPDGFQRTVARCRSPSTGDVGCALIQARVALPWARYGGGQCQ